MLIQFSFKNYGPFKEKAVFDMRAIKSYKEHDYNLIDIGLKEKVQKVATLYGANASGKTNFVDAYNTYWSLVLNSFNNINENGESYLEQNYKPFLFSKESSCEDTEFESIHIYNDFEYRYGFIYNNKKIVYEWLYQKKLSTGRNSVILERSEQKITLGSSVVKTYDKYVEEIEKNVLALTFFNRLKTKTTIFKDTFNCIFDIVPLKLTCDGDTKYYTDLYFKDTFNKKGEKDRLLDFIKAIDIGIKDITVSKNNDNIDVKTHHIDNHGNDYAIPFKIESDGTKRVIALFSFISIAIRHNRGLIVDELNMQLHPLLLKYIIDLFYTEGSKGQLIFTTHDTTFLDKKFFRRDQLWFVEKNEWGESTIYSMSEFKVRNDSSFTKDYLGGQYGAIPVLNDYSMED